MSMPILLNAQSKEDKQNILNLCGCYDVTFEYAETFRTDTNYQYHDNKTAHARELIIPIEQADDKIILQHMLVVNDNYIIKHWREDWTYQQPTLLTYKGNNTWEKSNPTDAQVSGKWTQTVWQVDDMPRYQGYSHWLKNDSKTYWESTAFAPLPRREYTARSDYNIMKRTNKIFFTDNGWVHEQDNEKIIRSEENDSLLVKEKGLNTYVKIDDSKCTAAMKQWEESKEFWVAVRAQWQEYIDDKEVLIVKKTVEDEKLYERFYALEAEWKEAGWNKKQLGKKVKEVMDQFIDNNKTARVD